MSSRNDDWPTTTAGEWLAAPPGESSDDAQAPFYYTVAENLHCLLNLPQDRNLGIWRHVLDLYAESGRQIPEFLRDLCRPAFVEELMENEIFWGLAGTDVDRLMYAHATDYLPAVYATAALVAARGDHLPLNDEERALIGKPTAG